MHEYGLVERVVAEIVGCLSREGGGAREIIEVHVKAGALEMHSREAFEQAWEVLARGTELERAALRLVVVPAAWACPACGAKGSCDAGEADVHQALPCVECPSCGAVAPVSGGLGIGDIEVVVEEPGDPVHA
jgi:Zn finger protein HypA/HybF involved in hydrogenase expression